MRIFHVNTFCGIKSTGRIVSDIVHLLYEQGDECLVGYGAGSVPEKDRHYAYRIGGWLGRKWHAFIRKFFDAEGYGSVVATMGLIRRLNSFRPDIIHLHNLHGCYLNFRILFAYFKRARIPIVWTLHDCWSFTGHCAYFDYVECKKWTTECLECPQQCSYPICLGVDGSRRNYHMKKKAFRGVHSLTLAPPSRWLAKYIPQSFLAEYPVRVMNNGVDRTVFYPVNALAVKQKFELTGKYIILSVASDWDERKGLRYLLQTEKLLGEDYHMMIVGLTKEQISILPANMTGISATHCVKELVELYSAADCFVNPTMEDNMPMVNLEALACATPVVVFETGGCVEVVDNSCGKLVPKGDAHMLAEAIKVVAPNKASYRDACLARASKFDQRKCYQSYLDLYEELQR